MPSGTCAWRTSASKRRARPEERIDVDEPIIEREILIDAPPELVASYFTDPARIVQWWATRADVAPVPRGSIRMEFDKPDGLTDVALGEFVEIGQRRIVFTWGFEGGVNLPPGSSRVEVTLTPQGNGTRLRLVHRGLPADHFESHETGWSYFLRRLSEIIKRT